MGAAGGAVFAGATAGSVFAAATACSAFAAATACSCFSGRDVGAGAAGDEAGGLTGPFEGRPLAQGDGAPPVRRGVGRGRSAGAFPHAAEPGAAARDVAPSDSAAANSPALVGRALPLAAAAADAGRACSGAIGLGAGCRGGDWTGAGADAWAGAGALWGRRRSRGRDCGRLSGSGRLRRGRGLGGDLRRRFGRRRHGRSDLGSPHGRARHKKRRSLAVLARWRRGAIDLRLQQNVVRPADHDQVFDIVAPDEHQLALPVEAESVDQPEPRLAGPSARNAQPMGERQPIENRQNDEGGDAAGRKESDLKDPIVRERKLIQPLHAQSKTSAPRARQAVLQIRLPNDGLACARESRIARSLFEPAWRAARERAPNPIGARSCHIHNKMRSR